jgi:hypothetical protein
LLQLTPVGKRLRSKLQARMLETSPVMVALEEGERALLRDLLAKAAGAAPTTPSED